MLEREDMRLGEREKTEIEVGVPISIKNLIENIKKIEL